MAPQSLKRTFLVFEFILAAHMIFSIIVEMQSVVFPIHQISELIKETPNKAKNPHANHSEIFDLISFFGFCIWLGLKYLFEGMRLNTVIICTAEFLFFSDRALQYADKIFCQISAILTLIYIYTLLSLPTFELPEPTGQFKVGYRQIRLSDSYQTKAAVFYPASNLEGFTQQQIKRMTKQITWAPHKKFVKQIYEYMISRQWVPYPEWVLQWTVNHLLCKKFSCLLNADLVELEDNNNIYPVIIFSHGLSQHYHSYTSFARQWASQGNIVICPQHEELVYPWDNKGTKIKFQNNSAENLKNYKRIRGHHLDWRVEQVRAVIDHILIKEKFTDIFNKECEVDASQLIVIGHSFGGTTAIRTAQLDERVKGIMTIDPWLFPFTKEQLNTAIPKNIQVLNIFQEYFQKDDIHNKQEIEDLIEANSSIKERFISFKLKGMDHAHPTDVAFFIPGEMEFTKRIRQYENIQEIYESVCQLTTIFISNFIKNKHYEPNRDKLLVIPFNDWSQNRWKSTNRLIFFN